MITREVMLAGARAHIDIAAPDMSPEDREITAANMVDHPRGAVRAAIIAAVEADRATPVPWGPNPEIPAQRAGFHAQ